jgi:Holliday junction DNA helicase RuvA
MNENSISLWGFIEKRELDLFKLLIGVSGVGPKTAAQIINLRGYDNIVNAIALNQPKDLKVSGVGVKTSEKIIIELKSKFKDYKPQARGKNLESRDSTIIKDAKDGLAALGYRLPEIERVIENLANLDDLSDSRDLIREILKHI